MPMQFKYVRIEGKELAPNTLHAKGVFSMCWQMIQDEVMVGEDKYQIATKAGEYMQIGKLQESWSPE